MISVKHRKERIKKNFDFILLEFVIKICHLNATRYTVIASVFRYLFPHTRNVNPIEGIWCCRNVVHRVSTGVLYFPDRLESLPFSQLPERHRGGRRHVEGIDVVVHRDAHHEVAAVDGVRRQAVAFGAHNHR